jgi:hypothetical protein
MDWEAPARRSCRAARRLCEMAVSRVRPARGRHDRLPINGHDMCMTVIVAAQHRQRNEKYNGGCCQVGQQPEEALDFADCRLDCLVHGKEATPTTG